MVKITTFSLLAFGLCLLQGCSLTTMSGPESPVSSVDSVEATPVQAYAVPLDATIQKDSQGFRVNALRAPANQTYYFSFDRSNMRQQDQRALTVQARYLAQHQRVRVTLFGNTDSRGSREYNIALGLRRDQAVAAWMKRYGVSAQQMSLVSFGKEDPAVLGNTPRAWALNRRVELKYKG